MTECSTIIYYLSMDIKQLNYSFLNNDIFDDIEILEFLNKFKEINNQVYYKWGMAELNTYLSQVAIKDDLSLVFTMRDLALLSKIQRSHEIQFSFVSKRDIFDFTF